jgi:hypothetical protein
MMTSAFPRLARGAEYHFGTRGEVIGVAISDEPRATVARAGKDGGGVARSAISTAGSRKAWQTRDFIAAKVLIEELKT